ncbi:hypothetical protein EMCRGX_G014382 [Ephydatia muelleri]
MFNGSVSTIGVTTSKLTQKMLSCKLEDMQFTDRELFANVSLLSGFQFPRLTHQLGYLSHLPQGLTFIPIHLSFKWWLGLLGALLEAGSSLGHEARQTRPANILIPNWELGKPAAVDLCITSPLNYKTLQVACVIPGSAAWQAEKRKHHSNDATCLELGWTCIPLVVESFGCWGPEAQRSLSRLAGGLATRLRQPKSITTNQIYGMMTTLPTNSRAAPPTKRKGMANVQKFAAEDAQRISVIRQGYIQSTTFVAELRLTSAAGHVITSLVSLDVDPACWTLSAVGVIGCHTGTLGPILELSLSRLEGLAREPRVPRGVALEAHSRSQEAHLSLTSSSFNLNFLGSLCSVIKQQRGHVFLALVLRSVDQKPFVLVPQFFVSADDPHDLFLMNELVALGVRARDPHIAVVHLRAHDSTHTRPADVGLTAVFRGPLGYAVHVAEAHDAVVFGPEWRHDRGLFSRSIGGVIRGRGVLRYVWTHFQVVVGFL